MSTRKKSIVEMLRAHTRQIPEDLEVVRWSMAYNEREEKMNEWEDDELPKGEVRTTYSFLLRNHQDQEEYKY